MRTRFTHGLLEALSHNEPSNQFNSSGSHAFWFCPPILPLQSDRSLDRIMGTQQSTIETTSTFVGVYRWNPDQQLIYADNGMCDFFGVPPPRGLAGVAAQEFRQRIPLDDRARIRPMLVRAADDRQPFSVTYRVVTPTRGIRQVRSYGRAFNSRGQSLEYVGAVLDIGSGASIRSPLVEAIDFLMSARDQMARTDHAILTKLIDAVLMEANREQGRSMGGTSIMS